MYSYLETLGGQSSNLYLNVVHFFNTNVNETSVADKEYCFPALVPNIIDIKEYRLLKACLVCFISTVNSRSKKKEKKPIMSCASSRHITKLKQSIFAPFDIYA